MNFGKLAIALWVVTAAAFAFFFVKGVTSVSEDKRQAIRLDAKEKDMVLGEMRTILSAVNGVLVGLSASDMPAVSKAAQSAGMAMAVDGSPVLMAKLPLEFKTLGMSLHEDFDKLSANVNSGFNKDQVLSQLAEITNKCVSCHHNYRLSSGGSD